MGNKVHCYGFRVGVTSNFRNSWAPGTSKEIRNNIILLHKIKKEWDKSVKEEEYSTTEVHIRKDFVNLFVYSQMPQKILGVKGENIKNIQQKLNKKLNIKKIEISIIGILHDSTCHSIAKTLGKLIETKGNYKFGANNMLKKIMSMGYSGMYLRLSGPAGPNAITRKESISIGNVPRTTLSSCVDQYSHTVKTRSGTLGIQCILCYDRTNKKSNQKNLTNYTNVFCLNNKESGSFNKETFNKKPNFNKKVTN